MAIDSGLKKADGGDLGNNLFAGNGTSNGNQTFNIVMKNGVDLGKGWYNASECYATVGNIGFKNAAGKDIGTLLGKYGTLNCTCDVDVDTCDTDKDICDSDTDGCFIKGHLLTRRGLVEVSEIQLEDAIWGADEKWHSVIGVVKNVVGLRKVYELKNGGIVTDDHVVFSGDCAYVPSLDAWQKTKDSVLVAENRIAGRYLSSTPVEIDGAKLLEVHSTTPIFSPICETRCVGYLNGERVLIASKA